MMRAPGMLRVVRAIEAAAPERVAISTIAEQTHLSRGSVAVYVSRIRALFGYTCIDGTPAVGYRLGEWPGRNAPPPTARQAERIRRREERQRAREQRRRGRALDSSDGVVVTEAGRRLGL